MFSISSFDMYKFALLFLATVATALGGQVSPAGLRHTKVSSPASLPKDASWMNGDSMLMAVGDDTACTAVFSCADCNTARICRPDGQGAFTTVKTVTCPTDKPYCDFKTGSCSTLPDGTCGQTDDFVCLEDGHFPDADCKTYHVCDNLQAHKFQCIIDGQTYNADSKKCETSSQCAKVECDEPGKKVSSDLYPSYYAYCDAAADTPTKGTPAVITRCDGNTQLNATSQMCEPICQMEGVLEDVEDCTKYYKCSNVWISETQKYMIRERLSCPDQMGFNPKSFMCVSTTEFNCKKPTGLLSI